jgi:hypothetical protein
LHRKGFRLWRSGSLILISYRKEFPMRKKAKTPKQNPKRADSLLKTSKKKDIELIEKELEKVTGGTFTNTRKDKIMPTL